MEIGGLYQFILVLVLIGVLLGVGILLLDKFAAVDGVGTSAQTALNATRDSLGDIASDWLPIIVIVAVCAVILYLVVSSFMGQRKR